MVQLHGRPRGKAFANTATLGANAGPPIGLESDNVAPTLALSDTGPGATLDYSENDPAAAIAPTALLTDPDSADFDSGVLTVSFEANGTADDQLGIRHQGTGAGQIGVAGANVTFANVVIGTFSGGANGTSLVVTLDSDASLAAVQALIRNITYANLSDNPSIPPRTVGYSVSDGDGGNAQANATVNLTALDDAAVARNDAAATDEATAINGGNLFADSGSGADSDVDGPALSVAAVNGSGTAVNSQITLASGALLTVNANGTFDYDPHGAFNQIPAAGSGASNTSATDSFQYSLANGGTATVTITIHGLDSNDILFGTAGIDSLAGGIGNDKYIVGNSGDLVTEAAGAGSDSVSTLVDYMLAPGSEIERLNSISWALTTPLALTGNGFANIVEGNAGHNLLDGGGGADRLIGFGGNDRYLVDHAGDVVTELAGNGEDTILTSVDHALAAGNHVERLRAMSPASTTPVKLTGNSIANLIEGNAGDNLLDGRGGADRLVGFGGNDKYVVDHPDDVVVETAGGGQDSISTLVDYTLTAGSPIGRLSSISWALTTPLQLVGNEFANTIEGNAGANRLDGKGDADRLVGFGGADIFAFTTPLGNGNIDTIVGFQVGVDKIHLEAAVFAGLTQAALANGALVVGSAAQDAEDRIIYNSASGALLFDYDGAGGEAAVQFAILSPGLAITADDFVAPPAFLAPTLIGFIPGMIGVGDFNNDGFVEPFGFLNNGDGTFNNDPYTLSVAPILANYPEREQRHVLALDINGDGNLDAIWNVYSDPSIEDSFTLILYGDGTGQFDTYEERQDIDGFGETIITADFDNDGFSDVFMPVYTHVFGSDSTYLLFNDGDSLGGNQAEQWGVSLPAQPFNFRVEGAQAADVNFDGSIDFFTASHLFINQGTEFSAVTLDPFVFDEGANLLDYDNDGDFDLVMRSPNGEQFSPRLFTWDGTAFVDSGFLDAGNVNPGLGIQVYDVDSNGWEDVVYGGAAGLTVHFNHGGAFTQSTLALDVPFPSHISFFDHDNDGTADLMADTPEALYLFENGLEQGESLSLSVVGPSGELDQHGRSVLLVSEADPDIRMARAVESGSGYMSQRQYELLIGLPLAGAYGVEIPFATATLQFTAAAGQQVTAFADGRVNIAGSARDDVLGGGAGQDQLSGGSGNDRIVGSLGADAIDGGHGDDTIDYSGLGLAVEADLSAGSVEVGAHTQTVSLVEHLVGGSFADVLLGNALDNLLEGGDGNDHLDGSAGSDSLRGGFGDDVYVVDARDTIEENASGGTDEVRTAGPAYTLPAHFENLTGLSSQSQQLTGNDLDNVLTGGGGADMLRGGLGNDIYILGSGDTVEELSDGGLDEVRTASSSYTLSAQVENLAGLSAGGQELVGNDLGNSISGGGGADTFRGGLGDDAYLVDVGDSIVEIDGEGTDEVRTALATYTLSAHLENLTGLSTGGQELIGNALANRLAGGAGADTLRGGLGDDLYVVGQGDMVVEEASQGADSVVTALVIYTLTANVEALTGSGSVSQKLIGNALDNMLTSSAAYSTLIGLQGDDIYYATTGTENAIEKLGEGTDVVRTLVNYRLPGNSHVETLEAADPAATAALQLSGNNLANTIIGNAGSNLFFGGGGSDQMIGRGGDDQYIVDFAGYSVTEASGEGFDTVSALVDYTLTAGSHIERLTSISWTFTTPLQLTGNEFANWLEGNAGSNQLDGKGGADLLTGFGGADTFAFTAVLGGGNIDQIADFQAGIDKIALDDAVFAALAPGALPAGAFVIGSAAADGNDRIVYNAVIGQLLYDADGSGGLAATPFATLQSGLGLTAGDFVVI